MDTPNFSELDLFKIKYDSIISNYKSLIENLSNISSDIKKLENIHNAYINNDDMSSLNFSIYVDDIKHQINLTKMEYKYISDVLYLNLNKFYRDLFKLYTKIVRNLLDIYKENKDGNLVQYKNTRELNFMENLSLSLTKLKIRRTPPTILYFMNQRYATLPSSLFINNRKRFVSKKSSFPNIIF